MDEEERSESIQPVLSKEEPPLLTKEKLTATKLLRNIKPALSGLAGPKILVFTGSGVLKTMKVDSALPVEIYLDPLRVAGITLTSKRSFFRNYDVHVQIPIALIRAYSHEVIIIESDGLQPADHSPDYVVYVAVPSLFGWALILEEQRELLMARRGAGELAVANEVIKAMDELISRAVKLSIPGKVTSELRAIPSPIQIREQDYQELIREKLKRMGITGEREGR